MNSPTRCYITAHSLFCSLGDNTKEIISQVQSINQSNYEAYLQHLFAQKPYYPLTQNFDSEEQKLYRVIDHVVKACIQEAHLSEEEQKELAIFIGSTAMGISLNEEAYALYYQGKSDQAFNHLGYGYLGDYLETLTHSNHKALLFSTACTSSVNALAYAAKLIASKQIKRALVVGIELFNKATFNGFSSLMLLSKSKIYRPFDKQSDGIILGEACSALLLESEPRSAEDFYYKGSKNICDIYSETTSNPSGEPIFHTMDEALRNASLKLSEIDFIKAHATGSENNNTSEANAIALLFEKHGTTTPITALKPLIGHTLGASGTNEIALTLSCLKEGFIPPTLGFQERADGVSFTPLLNPVKRNGKKTNVLFNFVAFGGNTTSLVLSNV